jgi:hypothetical protein
MEMLPRKRHLISPQLWFPAIGFVAALGAIMLQSGVSAGTLPSAPGITQQRVGAGASKIKVGAFPPDFELPFLNFGENEEGKPIGIVHEEDTFRLSSFQGKKPVCMIMSSYT